MTTLLGADLPTLRECAYYAVAFLAGYGFRMAVHDHAWRYLSRRGRRSHGPA